MIAIIILSIFICVFSVVCAFADKEIYSTHICLFLSGAFILLISLALHNSPTAMDVYQGNTTLEITYRDGVPTDSVVVFKK